jgi:hypothetical protein
MARVLECALGSLLKFWSAVGRACIGAIAGARHPRLRARALKNANKTTRRLVRTARKWNRLKTVIAAPRPVIPAMVMHNARQIAGGAMAGTIAAGARAMLVERAAEGRRSQRVRRAASAVLARLLPSAPRVRGAGS